MPRPGRVQAAAPSELAPRKRAGQGPGGQGDTVRAVPARLPTPRPGRQCPREAASPGPALHPTSHSIFSLCGDILKERHLAPYFLPNRSVCLGGGDPLQNDLWTTLTPSRQDSECDTENILGGNQIPFRYTESRYKYMTHNYSTAKERHIFYNKASPSLWTFCIKNRLFSFSLQRALNSRSSS